MTVDSPVEFRILCGNSCVNSRLIQAVAAQSCEPRRLHLDSTNRGWFFGQPVSTDSQ